MPGIISGPGMGIVPVPGLLQGLTEFLPVSSSGHLLLWQVWSGARPSLFMDVVLHGATLLALVALFWRDFYKILAAVPGWGKPWHRDPDADRGRHLVLATLPILGVGFLVHQFAPETAYRNWTFLAVSSIVFGFLLGLADWVGVWLHRRRTRRTRGRADGVVLNGVDALFLGLAQCLALIPGVSRAGIVMTAGRLRGLSRHESARFSMMLSAPVIAGAIVLEGAELLWGYGAAALQAELQALGGGLWLFTNACAAFITAWVTMRLFLTLIERLGLWPFALYRMILGFFLLLWGGGGV